MKIKEARLSAGLTQKEFSEMFEIPIDVIKSWDTGRRKPPAWAEKLLLEKLENLPRKGEEKMKRYEFTGTNELSEKAFEVYSNSDFTFYKQGETFFVADNQKADPNELGSLEDVEEFLIQFA